MRKAPCLRSITTPETSEWELVDYTVNTAYNTVTITTDHLSEYSTVTLRDAGSPYALLSKFSNKRMDNETALAILREFEATGKPVRATEYLTTFTSSLFQWGTVVYRRTPGRLATYISQASAVSRRRRVAAFI